jgi:hypothetical protein
VLRIGCQKKKKDCVFWVKYEGTIWHAKTGWMKMQSNGALFVIPSPDYEDQKNRQVTHWMPLPEPPKGKA